MQSIVVVSLVVLPNKVEAASRMDIGTGSTQAGGKSTFFQAANILVS